MTCRPDAPWKENQDAMRSFQAQAERVGCLRAEMEQEIARMRNAFLKETAALEKARYATLYGLKDDPEHNADGTPKCNPDGSPVTTTKGG